MVITKIMEATNEFAKYKCYICEVCGESWDYKSNAIVCERNDKFGNHKIKKVNE